MVYIYNFVAMSMCILDRCSNSVYIFSDRPMLCTLWLSLLRVLTSQLVFLVYPFSASVKIATRLKLPMFNEEIDSVLAVDTITNF